MAKGWIKNDSFNKLSTVIFFWLKFLTHIFFTQKSESIGFKKHNSNFDSKNLSFKFQNQQLKFLIWTMVQFWLTLPTVYVYLHCSSAYVTTWFIVFFIVVKSHVACASYLYTPSWQWILYWHGQSSKYYPDMAAVVSTGTQLVKYM